MIVLIRVQIKCILYFLKYIVYLHIFRRIIYVDLYKRITTLCDNKKISAGQMCKDINLSRGIITDLKMGRKKNLSTDTLTKIANYFKVPINFLLGTPPFDFWEQIDTNRKTFLTNLGISEEALQMIWGIPADTEDMDISRLINLIDAMVMSVSIDSEGNWITTLKKGIKKLLPMEQRQKQMNLLNAFILISPKRRRKTK